jgi:SAM-dependent methyltransferase
MGKPVVHLSVREGYRLWAPTYDSSPNPLLALEERIAAPVLGSLVGARVADLCTGTGRWMTIMRRMEANVVGIDLSPEMLSCANRKPGCARSLVLADLGHLPLRSCSVDLAICSFGISYVASLAAAFREIARIARRVLISDLHPAAIHAGWRRSFDTAAYTCCVAHRARTLDELDEAAATVGFSPEHSVEAHFGEPERNIFARAGKTHIFDEVSRIPAIFVKTWTLKC